MRDRCDLRHDLVTGAALVVVGCAPTVIAGDVVLRNAFWEISLSAPTLRTCATPNGKATVELSAAQTGLGRVTGLQQTDQTAHWTLRERGITIAVELRARDLHVRIRSAREGTFTWPRAEGAYIPLDDARWVSYLAEHGDWDTLASLSMPFWGVEGGDFTLTYIATCPYNNAIRFAREDDTLRASFTHEFTQFQRPRQYGFVVSLSENTLSELMVRKDFYEPRSWSATTPPKEAVRLLGKDRDRLTVAETCRLNSQSLYSVFSDFLITPADWGDGVSTKMLARFQEAGFDRLRLCVSGWEGIEKRPLVAKAADEMGYLFGTYDFYHSIHDPALQGTDDTWPTAQFDRQLFERGHILRRDGAPRAGFKGVGAKLSPVAAWPYVEERVRRNMANVPYSCYFVDCDAYGEVYDDYSPLHPCGQADDAAAGGAAALDRRDVQSPYRLGRRLLSLRWRHPCVGRHLRLAVRLGRPRHARQGLRVLSGNLRPARRAAWRQRANNPMQA